MIPLFVFSSVNETNIWAGIGAQMWAVSCTTDHGLMSQRQTFIRKHVRIGAYGIIYRTAPVKSITTPFLFTSLPDLDPQQIILNIWPEAWTNGFGIHPLGTPRRSWDAKDAICTLPFNKDSGNTNIASVLKVVPTATFNPVSIGPDDWAMIMEKLT